MVTWISNSTLGQMIQYATVYVTGDLGMAILGLGVYIWMMAVLLKFPMEVSLLLISPLLVVLMAFDSQFLTLGGALLFYLAIAVVRWWLE